MLSPRVQICGDLLLLHGEGTATRLARFVCAGAIVVVAISNLCLPSDVVSDGMLSCCQWSGWHIPEDVEVTIILLADGCLKFSPIIQRFPIDLHIVNDVVEVLLDQRPIVDIPTPEHVYGCSGSEIVGSRSPEHFVIAVSQYIHTGL